MLSQITNLYHVFVFLIGYLLFLSENTIGCSNENASDIIWRQLYSCGVSQSSSEINESESLTSDKPT